MKQMDYTLPLHFPIYPAPGPMAQSSEGNRPLSLTIFEEHAPFTTYPGAAAFLKVFKERATKLGMPYTSVEVQAAASYSAWKILEAGVRGANGFWGKKIGIWLKKNKVQTIHGNLRFDGIGNYGDDLMKVKQVQNGNWVVVWPKQFAPANTKLLTQ